MGLVSDKIPYFLKYAIENEDFTPSFKYLDTSMGRSSFISLCEGLEKVVENAVSGWDDEIDYEDIVEGGFEEVFVPVIIPLLDAIDNYRKALENQLKYGTKITVTTEQMDKLIVDYNINKEESD